MSALKVFLTTTPPPAPWNNSASISFAEGSVTLHVTDEEAFPLKAIKRSARKIAGLGSDAVKLEGEWSFEHQLAFAQSFYSWKQKPSIEWSASADAGLLDKHFKALVFTRDLINQPPQDIFPQSLANLATEYLTALGGDSISVTTVAGDELLQAGWIGIHAVGRASTRAPLLLEVDYNPSGDPNAPVTAALVGKGITFDSGGYSIKSSEGMLHMKCDMGGAATVTGALGLAISLGLSKRVKLYLCCAENLIDGNAYKLGDVLTYKNGTKVEIVNTDAEGRLVLADGLMAATEAGAELIVDAATLTGAAMVAVGGQYNALFTMSDELRSQVLELSKQEQELTWPLPLEPWHQGECPSAYADTANSRPQKGGGAGGASNAAGFLSRFVGHDNWAHFDLAAAYNNSATAEAPAGATAQGIRTIAKLIMQD